MDCNPCIPPPPKSCLEWTLEDPYGNEGICDRDKRTSLILIICVNLQDNERCTLDECCDISTDRTREVGPSYPTHGTCHDYKENNPSFRCPDDVSIFNDYAICFDRQNCRISECCISDEEDRQLDPTEPSYQCKVAGQEITFKEYIDDGVHFREVLRPPSLPPAPENKYDLSPCNEINEGEYCTVSCKYDSALNDPSIKPNMRFRCTKPSSENNYKSYQ